MVQDCGVGVGVGNLCPESQSESGYSKGLPTPTSATCVGDDIGYASGISPVGFMSDDRHLIGTNNTKLGLSDS